MEIEIIQRKEQALLKRIEIRFKVNHAKEKTPDRKTVRDELAKLLKAKKDNIVIDSQTSSFGKPETIGYAKIYDSTEILKEIERKHILARNKIVVSKDSKKADKKTDKKPEEKTAPKGGEPPKEKEKPEKPETKKEAEAEAEKRDEKGE